MSRSCWRRLAVVSPALAHPPLSLGARGCYVAAGLEYYEAVVPSITAGLASNFAFRILLGIEATPVIWTFKDAPAVRPAATPRPLLTGPAPFRRIIPAFAQAATRFTADPVWCWERCP